MTRLRQRLAQMISANGPISVADYMALCLFDPQDGYYMTREPFGAAGDFITAPEISQMFGELVGVWLKTWWDESGKPMPVTIVEIGPGRGTLMRDIARTLKRLDAALFSQATLALIEVSPRLRAVQQTTLADIGRPVSWHDTIEALPASPVMIVANELFDAIPLRQFVKAGGVWRERAVGLDGAGALRFVAAAGSLDTSLLPPGSAEAPDGAIVELAPARSALMDALCARIASQGGCGLFIDYGYLLPGLGDTFQALRRHEPEDVLARPGEADLTAHVDFAALAAIAQGAGLQTDLSTQGEFLLGLGLLERAGSLGAQATEAGRQAIGHAVDRLAGPRAMGTLFKVLSVRSPAAAAQTAPGPQKAVTRP